MQVRLIAILLVGVNVSVNVSPVIVWQPEQEKKWSELSDK